MSFHPEGRWSMWCFNALSEDQQRMVVEKGYLDIFWTPEGTKCRGPATLELETSYDEYPGPRFYCVSCAIEYLQAIRDKELALPLVEG